MRDDGSSSVAHAGLVRPATPGGGDAAGRRLQLPGRTAGAVAHDSDDLLR